MNNGNPSRCPCGRPHCENWGATQVLRERQFGEDRDAVWQNSGQQGDHVLGHVIKSHDLRVDRKGKEKYTKNCRKISGEKYMQIKGTGIRMPLLTNTYIWYNNFDLGKPHWVAFQH